MADFDFVCVLYYPLCSVLVFLTLILCSVTLSDPILGLVFDLFQEGLERQCNCLTVMCDGCTRSCMNCSLAMDSEALVESSEEYIYVGICSSWQASQPLISSSLHHYHLQLTFHYIVGSLASHRLKFVRSSKPTQPLTQ